MITASYTQKFLLFFFHVRNIIMFVMEKEKRIQWARAKAIRCHAADNNNEIIKISFRAAFFRWMTNTAIIVLFIGLSAKKQHV